MWDPSTTQIGLAFVHEVQRSNEYVPHAEQPTPHSQTRRTHWRRQIQLPLRQRPITIGVRLNPAHPTPHPTTHPRTAVISAVDQPASE